MLANLHIADVTLTNKPIAIGDIKAIAARKNNENPILVLVASKLGMSWPSLFETLGNASIAASLAKTSRGRVVVLATPAAGLEDLTMQVANALRLARAKKSRFFVDRGFLPLVTSENQDGQDHGLFDETARDAGRRPFSTKNLAIWGVSTAATAVASLAFLFWAPTAPEAGGKSAAVQVSSSQKSVDQPKRTTALQPDEALPFKGDFSLGAIESRLRDGATKIKSNTFDNDVLLDAFVRDGLATKVDNIVQLGGLVQIWLEVQGQEHSLIARFSFSDAKWRLDSISQQ